MTKRVIIEKVEPLSHRWVKLDRYTIRYTRQDGTEDTLVREVHDHGHGATVLPYDAKRGTVLLVRQFRLPAYLSDGGDGFIIETCAGLLDGDDPAVCARREAEEELALLPDTPARDADHGHRNVVANQDPLSDLSTQYKHGNPIFLEKGLTVWKRRTIEKVFAGGGHVAVW